jgi:hypothetical protein
MLAHFDGEPSGGSSVCRPGSEDPHRRERNFFGAHVCKDTLKEFPYKVISEVSEPWGKMAPLSAQQCPNIFVTEEPMQNFRTLGQHLLGFQ